MVITGYSVCSSISLLGYSKFYRMPKLILEIVPYAFLDISEKHHQFLSSIKKRTQKKFGSCFSVSRCSWSRSRSTAERPRISLFPRCQLINSSARDGIYTQTYWPRGGLVWILIGFLAALSVYACFACKLIASLHTVRHPRTHASVILHESNFLHSAIFKLCIKKVKVAHTRLPSVGFRSWSRFLAVSLQVTWVINPAVGCHYFPPGLQLPLQPLRGLLPILLLSEQRHYWCE